MIRVRSWARVFVAYVGVLSFSQTTLGRASECNGFTDAFAALHLNGTVKAAVTFDDGSGKALWVGGAFSTVAGLTVRGLARWDGVAWHDVPDIVPGIEGAGLTVTALHVQPGSPSPKLFAAGRQASGVSFFARWNGSGWTTLPTVALTYETLAIDTFDAGNGPRLYAAGRYGLPVAMLGDAGWEPIADMSQSEVETLMVADLGTGPSLYIAGRGLYVNGTLYYGIVRFDGSGFAPLGLGLYGGDRFVRSLLVQQTTAGSLLVAAGDFESASGPFAPGVARWNGNQWLPTMPGLASADVRAIATVGAGPGQTLYAAGQFSAGAQPARIARWTGVQWKPVTIGPTASAPDRLFAFDAGSGEQLLAGAEFTAVGDVAVHRLERLDPIQNLWSPVDPAVNHGLTSVPTAFAWFDDGTGSALFVAAREPLGTSWYVAKRTGTTWTKLGANQSVAIETLAVHDDGTGPALYAGGSGSFGVSRWSGSAWIPVGATSGGDVRALVSHDFGTGARLYAAGAFTAIGGSPTPYLASFDGVGWSAAGAALDAPVLSLLSTENGPDGPRTLYAGGWFRNAGAQVAGGVAALHADGSWTTLDGGVSIFFGPEVRELALHDFGTGPELVVAGKFNFAGSTPLFSPALVRWTGSQWLPSGFTNVIPTVTALASFDAGDGPALYVAGPFESAGGVPVRQLARLQCGTWESVGEGLVGGVPLSGAPIMLTVPHSADSPSRLFIGGEFSSAAGAAAWHVAELDVCDPGIESFGGPCPGTGGVAPSLEVAGCLSGGGPIEVAIEDGASNALAWLCVGLGTGSTVLHGCEFHIATLSIPPIPLPLNGDGALAIFTTVPTMMPTLDVRLQVVIADAGGPADLSATNAVIIRFPGP